MQVHHIEGGTSRKCCPPRLTAATIFTGETDLQAVWSFEQGQSARLEGNPEGRPSKNPSARRNLQLDYAPNPTAPECPPMTRSGKTAFTITAAFDSCSTTRSIGASNSYVKRPDS